MREQRMIRISNNVNFMNFKKKLNFERVRKVEIKLTDIKFEISIFFCIIFLAYNLTFVYLKKRNNKNVSKSYSWKIRFANLM